MWQQGQPNNYEPRRSIATGKKYLKNSKKDALPLFRFQTLAAKKVVGEKAHCHFCGAQGVIMKKFPRRGYGYRKEE
jgi:hypothetical protein